MIKLFFDSQKRIVANIEELFHYKVNPKDLTQEKIDRVKKSILELKEFKPIIVTMEGEVLGGNTRLEAYKQLGYTQVWVSVVTPKSEAEKLKYALVDNDSDPYNEQKLYELVKQYKDELTLTDYRADTYSGMNLADILNRNQGNEGQPDAGTLQREEDTNPTDQKLDSFLNGTIRQIVLYFDVPGYEKALTDLTQVKAYFHVEDNTNALVKLIEFWKDNIEPVPAKEANDKATN